MVSKKGYTAILGAVFACTVLVAVPFVLSEVRTARAQETTTHADGNVPLVGVELTDENKSVTAVPVVQVESHTPMDVTGDPLIDKIVGYLIALTSALIPVIGTLLALFLKHKWNIDEEESKHAIEEILRGGFQTSLENGAGWLIQKLGKEVAANTKFEVSDPNVAQAIEMVKRGASKAIDVFGSTPEDIAARLQAKVGLALGLTDDHGNPLAPTAAPLNVTSRGL